jgi:hypothetical protein
MSDQVSSPKKTRRKIKAFSTEVKELGNQKFKDNREVKTL